jgi:hypothetical protein
MNANDNISMKMNELLMWINEFQLYTWVTQNSLVFRITDYVGLQWAIFVRTVVKGPLRALVNRWIVHKVFRKTPWEQN